MLSYFFRFGLYLLSYVSFFNMRKNGRLGKVTKVYSDTRTAKVKVVDKVYVKRWKTYKRRTKGYLAESKFKNLKPGNTVLLRSCKPHSSQKKWEIVLIQD